MSKTSDFQEEIFDTSKARSAAIWGAASTLLFSFASLELRLREPAKPTGTTESGYPQGQRMHETERSPGVA